MTGIKECPRIVVVRDNADNTSQEQPRCTGFQNTEVTVHLFSDTSEIPEIFGGAYMFCLVSEHKLQQLQYLRSAYLFQIH